MRRTSSQTPFRLDPGPDAASAVGPGLNEFSVAWPFTLLIAGELEEFIDRWAEWFADAAQGRLAYPSNMPEREPKESWRRA